MKPGVKLTILLVSAAVLWGTIFFVGCSSNNLKKRAKAIAEKALLASVDCPESVTIKAISDPDSVFGRQYVTDDERMAIAMAMVNINQKVMADTDGLSNFDFNNAETTELMERQMSALSVLRSLIDFREPSKGKDPFSGWKVKIEYESVSTNGKPCHGEYWFILNKDADCVINSFEIPLL